MTNLLRFQAESTPSAEPACVVTVVFVRFECCLSAFGQNHGGLCSMSVTRQGRLTVRARFLSKKSVFSRMAWELLNTPQANGKGQSHAAARIGQRESVEA